MISELKLHHIGPVPDLTAEFGERLNLITGDNGLGKTFLLDACWYSLTRTWAGGEDHAFYPAPDASKDSVPAIDYAVIGKSGTEAENRAEYQFIDQTWKRRQARPPMPGLVIYARIDGGFSVWDPARNYWRSEDATASRPAAFQFSNSAVWDGLEEGEGDRKKVICNGLLRDVEAWRSKGNGSIALLQNVLKALSANDAEVLSIGEGRRVRLDDVRDIPTLMLPYGAVPVTQAAAGMRRVLALAYLLVWAWEEHRLAAKLQKEEPTRRIVLLFDEVEAHLHPKWQRVFMPALLTVVNDLLLENRAESVQVIATTHAPLVLASVESDWNAKTDCLFDFDLNADRHVIFRPVEFAKQGSASNWLTSESFDLKTGYAPAAERAMESTDAFMRAHPDPRQAPLQEAQETHRQLLTAIGGDDEYMAYWLPYFTLCGKNREAQQ